MKTNEPGNMTETTSAGGGPIEPSVNMQNQGHAAFDAQAAKHSGDANEERLPVDDIRRVTKLLPKESLARIRATQKEAVVELVKQLSQYWVSMPLTMGALRQHDPCELVPAFEHCAERQFDAYAEELLPHVPAEDQYTSFLAINVPDAILSELRPARILMAESPGSGEPAELIRILKTADPQARKQLEEDLSEPSGDWEIYLLRSFEHALLKLRPQTRNWSDPEATTNTQQLEMLFRLKYRLHLRLFINWHKFDERLRAHLSNRLEHWEGRWCLREADIAHDNRDGRPSAASGTGTPDDCGDMERASVRSAWLNQKLENHGDWDCDNAIALNGGPAYNTIRSYRRGVLTSRTGYVRKRIAKALKCDISEVPK
jgi:hypothetical protein